MKIFIDTADIEEIRTAADWGIIDGVTTNPSLVAKTGRRFEDVLVEICETVDGPISAEVVSTEADGMVEEGRRLAAVHPNVVVKVPITAEGIKATRRLSDDGIRVNVTLIFQPGQALLAAKAGAAFVSPFVGRLDDAGEDGMEVIASLVDIFDAYDIPTEILVASVRRPGHVIEAARLGADIATCPFKVIEQLMRHPLTDIGLERFLADWRNSQH
ncbi:MAG: fructose-6-phosphate aldolase [Deltaproteobacteria bacterium]|nr:MAG: fructose-6-phosphate aldolase [Deltaproteobacteria bacterium]